MERDFYHSNDFEELIREKADQYKMYPSEKVWKGIDRSLRSRRRWYWTGFVLLLSGVSYFAVNELLTDRPAPVTSTIPAEVMPVVSTAELVPFSTSLDDIKGISETTSPETITSEFFIEDSGDITAAFQLPLNLLPGSGNNSQEKASMLISGLRPLENNEMYNIELSWPINNDNNNGNNHNNDVETAPVVPTRTREMASLRPITSSTPEMVQDIDWFADRIKYRLPPPRGRISWQLAFSPTINYRKLTGNGGSRGLPSNHTIPMAIRIEGDINKFVNHKPALGFELGTHAAMRVGKRLSLKGGIQFNYSKYDIRAFKTPKERATISLNSRLSNTPDAIVSYTDLRNFGGSSAEDLKNQYFQLSLPVGFELRVFGNDKLQFNVASTIQPTYLLNKNTYLITTDLKNYTKEPSLVRRWNVNTGAEAYVSYTRGDVKWQVGPQFRYQLLSSYQNVYPIKEYLMEYGIKVGITKTIR